MNRVTKKSATAEIIAIGNEILIGKTLDTNTNWLAKKLTELGVYVKRAMIVRDNIKDIVDAIDLAMKSATFVVTTGGLGPTEDDLTLKAISRALGKELKLNEQALKMVKRRYDALYKQSFIDSSEMTPARKKMAILPKDATPIFNPVGAAPGVLIFHRGVLLLILPGVPKEMYSIFNKAIGDIVTKIGHLESMDIKEVITDFRDESKLAPIIKSVQHEVNGVSLKSIAVGFGKDIKMKVRIVAWGETEEDREDKIETVQKLLREKYNVNIVKR